MKLTRIVLLVFIALHSQAQDVIILKGILHDKETGGVVPYASVGISGTSHGAAADEQGTFSLRIPQQHRYTRLTLASLGYYSRSFSIDSLLQLNAPVFLFTLTPDVPVLDEVVIKQAPINPVEIVREAIMNVSQNYYQKPFNMEIYSIIQTQNNQSGAFYWLESILKAYYNGYIPTGTKRFALQQVRTTGNDPLRKAEYGYWPSFEIHQADVVTNNRREGIFNADLLDEYEFTYNGVSIFDTDTVYAIAYRAIKPTPKNTGYGIVPKTYSGKVYITTSTHAVVKHEIEANDFHERGSLSRMLVKSFRYHVIYKKTNGYYFPYYVSGTRVNYIPIDKTVMESTITNTLQIQSINWESPETPSKELNETDINKISYHAAYWDANFPRAK